MEKTIENKLLPSDFLRAVLLELVERGKTEFPIDRVEWNKAFYSAIQQYGDKLPEFKVIKRINPYVHGLERNIDFFTYVGKLSYVPNTNIYRVEHVDVMKKTQEKFDDSKKELLEEVSKYICDRI